LVLLVFIGIYLFAPRLFGIYWYLFFLISVCLVFIGIIGNIGIYFFDTRLFGIYWYYW